MDKIQWIWTGPDVEPLGQMSGYAYFVQTCREEHKEKHPNENVEFAEFNMKCAERWKTVSDNEKKRFQDMAERDKKRFENMMANYKPPDGIKEKGKTRTKDPNAGPDAIPRGRMSTYAYFVQTCRIEHKKKHPNEDVVFAKFSKKCAERWKTIPDNEKKLFQDMAVRDKRYENKMTDYKPPGGIKKKDKTRTKDPNAYHLLPKSAFFWFCQDERSKVKAINPEHIVGEVAIELGKRWQKISEDTKSRYEQMAAKDKARYEKEIKAYKTKKAKGQSPAKIPMMGKKQSDDDDNDESAEEEGDDDYDESAEEEEGDDDDSEVD